MGTKGSEGSDDDGGEPIRFPGLPVQRDDAGVLAPPEEHADDEQMTTDHDSRECFHRESLLHNGVDLIAPA